MAVFTSSRLPGATGGQLLSRGDAARDHESPRQPRLPRVEWVERARPIVQMAGLVLVAVGLLLALGALWIQLARALPLAPLLHHPRVLRAMILAGAGLGLLLMGRHRPGRSATIRR